MAWYRNEKAVVVEALSGGERPDLATTMASGPLDELVALPEELGIFALLDELEVQRERAGVAAELLLRTLATLPCHPETLRDTALACRGVRVAARARSRSAGPLSAAVGAGQGLRRRWQRARR